MNMFKNPEFQKELNFCIGVIAQEQMLYDKCAKTAFRRAVESLMGVLLHSILFYFVFNGRFNIFVALLFVPIIFCFLTAVIDVFLMLASCIRIKRCRRYFRYVIETSYVKSIICDLADNPYRKGKNATNTPEF